jgi:hypothetical protein
VKISWHEVAAAQNLCGRAANAQAAGTGKLEVTIPSHSRGDKYLREIHSETAKNEFLRYAFQGGSNGLRKNG